jgi:hypothetical protein
VSSGVKYALWGFRTIAKNLQTGVRRADLLDDDWIEDFENNDQRDLEEWRIPCTLLSTLFVVNCKGSTLITVPGMYFRPPP